MPLLILFFLILLPSMEVYLLFSWIGESPAVAVPYLVLSSGAGFACLFWAKAGLRELLPRLRDARAGGEVRALLYIGKMWLVGALLLFPGYLTDVAAGLLLLLTRLRPPPSPPPSDDGIVQTRGRLLDDD